MVETCYSASSAHTNFYFFKNTEISNFGGILKFRLWTDFGVDDSNDYMNWGTMNRETQ
jgi:hypothetical protein